MTFSIVARSADASTGSLSWGVAVASKFLAVGAAVPAARAGAGALATQAFANLSYRDAGLHLLGPGTPAADVVRQLTGADDGRDQRQLGVVDRDGVGATFTGAACHPWAGGHAGDGYAIQGNILAGPQVVEAMERAWLGSAGGLGDAADKADTADTTATAGPTNMRLAARLLRALVAGDGAGGDRRGRQSAALLVVRQGGGYAGSSDVAVDLRVDDAPDPVVELGRLLDLHELYFGRPDPATLLPLDGALATEVAELLARLGYRGGDALADWAGVENYEMRLVPGQLDPVVLGKLREAAS